jgi:PPK2 family polyphosphate:nucleotide phosphotransferase
LPSFSALENTLKIESPFLIKPHAKVSLEKLSTSAHPRVRTKDAADKLTVKHREQLAELQEVFYASQKKALLIVLQGMDTAGKDGTISHIFSGVNPQGCQVASFKVPTPLEMRHDFLWRCQAQVPPRGIIGIFNRSHYEQVLSPRIHGGVAKKQAHRDMDDINAWEESLTNNDTIVLKFFLHISHKEQTERLQSRIESPDKHWKLSPSDFAERIFWEQYQDAYEDILERTSTKHAPWFVIPSDDKWYRNVAISQVLVDVMQSLKLQYPKPTFDPSGINLLKENPETAAQRIKTLVEKSDIDSDSITTGKKSK